MTPLRLRSILLVAFVVPLFACAGGGSFARAGAMAPTAPSSTTVASAGANPTATQIPEQLVVEGSLSVEVSEVGDLVPALRTQVEAAGGRVITEQVFGGETSWSAHLKLRLPPAQVEPTIAWLAKRGDIVDKRIDATDVSRTLFDQQLALTNLQATSDRLQLLLNQGGLAMNDILAIEKELTRIRGEIESIKGEKRFLEDRVALATLDIALRRRDGAVTIAKAKFYPGARFSTLVLFQPEGRARTRVGGSIVLHTVLRSASFEVDLYQPEPAAAGAAAKPAVLATLGFAAYSDFLGRGQRKFGNPFLGMRLGYGYLDRSRFVIQAEVGLELYKQRHFVIEASARGTGLVAKDSDGALELGAGAVVAF
ncbi:MAG: DUF4349 domain-containing protein [Deltaproteobacteria bacterium]|nr:DUF4349 domain-containing protein [Deltaproteobacteria bacterium]